MNTCLREVFTRLNTSTHMVFTQVCEHRVNVYSLALRLLVPFVLLLLCFPPVLRFTPASCVVPPVRLCVVASVSRTLVCGGVEGLVS